MDNTISFPVKSESSQIQRQKNLPVKKMQQSASFAKVMTESTNNETKKTTDSTKVQSRQAPALKQIRQIAIPNMVRRAPAIKQVKKTPYTEKAKQSPAVEQTRQTPEIKKVEQAQGLQQTRQTATTTRQTPAPAQNKQTTFAEQVKQITKTAQDKKAAVSEQAKQAAAATQVKKAAVSEQTKQAAAATQIKKAVVSEQAKQAAATTQIKKAAVSEQAKQAAVATQVKKADVNEQAKQTAAAAQVKKAAVNEQAKQTPAATQVKKAAFTEQLKQTAPKQAKQAPVFIGQISKNNPTVSQLMVHNDEFGDKSWEIIHSPINKDKPYTRLREGTKVFIDPTNNELFLREKQDAAEGVSLGTLNKETPTISHLLAASEFDREKWQILSLPVNADKDFRHIPAGTEVRIDPLTKEISWGKGASRFGLQPDFSFPAPTKEIPLMGNELKFAPQEKTEDLSAAVQKFIGTPYSKMDCYGMVVKGLENIGVQYGGKEGLYRRLTDMAREKGLPANAYLTGEGLVEAAGSKVLYETFSSVEKPGLAARQTLEKMSNLLEKGQILSFSTPTRGHTGVISKQNDGEWTFINSGQMDHPINKAQTRKGVGEEALLAELTNWFELANKRKESLTVTLGKVDLAKLQRQQPESSGTLLASI